MILLIKKLNKTRDNSTGFTIQWGTATTNGTAETFINLPRAFNSTYKIVGNDGGSGLQRLSITVYNYIKAVAYASATCEFGWIAVGFS